MLAALVLPDDFLNKLESQLAGAGLDPAEVEVYVNEDDPVKASLVDDRISALITEANLVLSGEISKQLLGYLDILVEGGEFEVPFLGQTIDVLGLERSEQILRAVRAEVQGPQREVVDDVIRFAEPRPREPRLRGRPARARSASRSRSRRRSSPATCRRSTPSRSRSRSRSR